MHDNTRFQKAQQLHQQGQFKAAEQIYQELLTEQQAEPEAEAGILHALAILCAQTKRHQQALTLLDRAIQLAPEQATLYNSLGNIYVQLKQFDHAITQYQNAIHHDEDYAVAFNNLGRAYHLQNQLEPAQKYYQKATTLAQNYGDAHFNLGILLATLGESKTAQQHLETALTLPPVRPAAYGQLAELFLQQANYPQAIQHYQNRLKHEPEHVSSYFALGQAYLKDNQIDHAIAAFKQTLILQPQHPECHHYLANAELKKGDPALALNHYFRQLENQPMMETYYNIGVLLMQQNRYKESLSYLEKATALDPNYWPAPINLGAIYLKLNRIPDALRQYKAALAIKPEDAEIQYIVSALSAENLPDKAPPEYLSHLFDQYATYYDQHLTEHLHYQAHQLLRDAIERASGSKDSAWTILDLGCGTGLCGTLLAPFAKQLIGIDISEKMIMAARAKDIYHVLQVMDIETALNQFTHNHLIVAGDVFAYLGKLDTIFHKVHSALQPNGLFAFTVEKTNTEPYELQKNMRYAHSKAYITQLAQNQHYPFEIKRFDRITLRKQKKQPVEGYLVLLTRQSS